MMTDERSLARLRALPKVDLHRHLEGSMRLETLWELHCRQKQWLHPSLEALKAACTVPARVRPGFQGFLARFPGLRFSYGGPEALERIAAEAVADAAGDGVVHLELRFSPVFCAQRLRPERTTEAQRRRDNDSGEGGSHDVVSVAQAELAAEAVVRGARREAARCGIGVAFVVSLGRHFGVARNEPAARLLHRPVGRACVGLDLCGDEAFPADDYADFLREWKAAGRGITIHAGEDPNSAGAANVHRAVLEFGASRIGHGVRASGDRELVSFLAQRGIVLELCPTSNVQTHACRSFRAHPLKRFLSAGIAATINTDDPAISQTCLSLEYLRAARYCGLGFAELRTCALHAARAAFLAEPEKTALVRRVADGWKRGGR